MKGISEGTQQIITAEINSIKDQTGRMLQSNGHLFSKGHQSLLGRDHSWDLRYESGDCEE